MEKETIISVKNLTKQFNGRIVLNDISFDIYKGEVFVIMGCSGGGKSTLLKNLIGIYKPDKGSVVINSHNLADISEEEFDHLRRKFGMVFQSAALLDSLTVKDNVALPLREHTNLAEEIISIIVRLKLSLVGLRDFEDYFPSQLSGGMQKRVGIARAIALDPDIVFYDEPTSGLDPVMAAVIDKLILDLSRKLSITSVVITHDMQSVFKISDRVAMLHKGEIIALGSPQDIRNNNDSTVQQFINGHPEGPIDFFKKDVF